MPKIRATIRRMEALSIKFSIRLLGIRDGIILEDWASLGLVPAYKIFTYWFGNQDLRG